MHDTSIDPDGEPTSLEFANMVRVIGRHFRAMELGTVPGFRSPPRAPGQVRTMRRARDGAVTIAVAVKGRTRRDVLLDLMAGALATTTLMPNSPTAGQFRARVVEDLGIDVMPPESRDWLEEQGYR